MENVTNYVCPVRIFNSPLLKTLSFTENLYPRENKEIDEREATGGITVHKGQWHLFSV